MSLSKPTKLEIKERDESIAYLLSILKPGDTLTTVHRHTSRSGMQREISVVLNDTCLDYHVSRVIKRRIGKHDGIVMGGCGMDTGFQLVYLLGCYLWPNGTPVPHGRRNGEPDSNGGYALKQRWL